MRNIDNGEEKKKKKKKKMAFLVATTSLPAVYRPNNDRWNAARSCPNVCLILESAMYTHRAINMLVHLHCSMLKKSVPTYPKILLGPTPS